MFTVEIYSSDTARLCLERCEHFQVHLISDIQIQYILLPFNKFNVHAWSGWNHGLSISSQLDFMIIYWRDNYLLRGHVLSLLRFTTVLTIFWAHGLQINVSYFTYFQKDYSNMKCLTEVSKKIHDNVYGSENVLYM